MVIKITFKLIKNAVIKLASAEAYRNQAKIIANTKIKILNPVICFRMMLYLQTAILNSSAFPVVFSKYTRRGYQNYVQNVYSLHG